MSAMGFSRRGYANAIAPLQLLHLHTCHFHHHPSNRHKPPHSCQSDRFSQSSEEIAPSHPSNESEK
ncbi:hypothetical protein [Nostoc sp.]